MELQALIDGLKAHKSGAASYESVDEAIRVFEAMRDVDGEKVAKGLECCASGNMCNNKCPYNDLGYDWTDCVPPLAADALALIRKQRERIAELEAAQSARVMTLEEVRDNSEVVWLETKWSRAELCIVDHGESDSNWLWVSYGVDNSGNSAWKYYGKTWRCWTQRPTDEQREAAKWE